MALGVVVLAGIYIRSLVVFRVSSVDPADGVLPTSQQYIRLNFNHRLKPDQDTSTVSVKGAQPQIAFGKKDITLYFATALDEGTRINVTLTGAQSDKDERLTQTFVFIVRYVPFNKLPKQVQQNAIKATDSTETTHPLIKHLPYETEDFSIDYQLPNTTSSKVPLFISSKLINYEDPFAAADSPSSLQLLRKARDEALDWMKLNSYKPADYQLVFSEPYLVDEYSGVYVGDYTPQNNRD